MTLTIEPRSDVARPGYDRSRITTGIVHIGLGNFHRAHQAMYVDRLMNRGTAFEWGICGVGLLPGDARMRDVLTAQDHLYTLVVKHGDGTVEPQVIGSVHDYLFAPDDPEAVLRVLVAPTTRIVSLTVTEGGYLVDRATGEFDATGPAVRRDLRTPHEPVTAFGLITEALSRRRAAGTPPFTVMSCDNLPGNGEVTHRVVTAYAQRVDPELAAWIDAEVAFPNSMVDRITPVTSDADRRLVHDRYGIDDGWPVPAEPFVQWVLEDRFPMGRPAFEEVGVQVVDDVAPYELMKLRLLNASHQGLAYPGLLVGHTFAHEAATDPSIVGFLGAYTAEARPTLPPVPGIDLDAYVAELFERFTNPAIADTLARLATDASDRIPKFVLPAVRDNLAAGRPVDAGAALVAMWARYSEGTDEAGRPLPISDPLHERLAPLAARQRTEPLAFLAATDVFGDLAKRPAFTEPYLRALHSLHEAGTAGLLRGLVP
ncbi:mannitol dehydrogenase family protein [Pseudonocardia sp. DLS-67]